jgi:3-hydroxyacyl-CoA dehydrogenase
MEGARSSSAWDARSKGLLRPSDRVVMNRDHLLAAARTWAIELASGYVPPAEAAITVSGPSGKSTLLNEAHSARAAGRMSDADMAIADALATVLTGGASGRADRPLSERQLMQLEREALIELAKSPATQARIEHMLATGKPLRN